MTLPFDFNSDIRRKSATYPPRPSQFSPSTGFRLSASHKVSAYVHVYNGSDTMTLIPIDALSTTYIVPDLRSSDKKEQRVVFHSVYSQTNVTIALYHNNDEAASSVVSTVTGRPGNSSGSVDGGGTNSSKTVLVNSTPGRETESGGHEDSPVSGPTSLLNDMPSTTTVKATPSEEGTGQDFEDVDIKPTNTTTTDNSGNPIVGRAASSDYSTRVTRSVFFFSNALQSRTIALEAGSALHLQSDKPLGVVVILSSSSSPSSSSTSPSTPSSLLSSSSATSSSPEEKKESGMARDCCGEPVAGILTDMLPPSSTFGKNFYLPVVADISSIKFIVSGKINGRNGMGRR